MASLSPNIYRMLKLSKTKVLSEEYLDETAHADDNTMDLDPPSSDEVVETNTLQPSEPHGPDAGPAAGVAPIVRHKKCGHCGEFLPLLEKLMPSDMSWPSEVEADSDDEKEANAKKGKSCSNNARHARRNLNLSVDVAAQEQQTAKDAKIVTRKLAKIGLENKKNNALRTGTSHAPTKPSKPTKMVKPTKTAAHKESIMDHNVRVAATGTVGYIALGVDFHVKGDIKHCVDETSNALVASQRFPKSISYISAPAESSDGAKNTAAKIAAMCVAFPTEAGLIWALGPVTVLGLVTEVEKYRGSKGTVFTIPITMFYDKEKELVL